MQEPIKILLVESDEKSLNAFEEKFKNNDSFALMAAATGEKEALDFAKNGYPEVIITELKLRQGDGINLICEIREMESELPVKPYIVVVTHNMSDAISNMLNFHADYTFIKGADGYNEDMVLKHLNRMKDFIYSKYVARRGSEDSASNAKIISPMDKEQLLRKHIQNKIINKLCISPDLIGREYLLEAIVIGVGVKFQGAKNLQHSKDIYPVLKARYKNRIPNINNAINVALENAWDDTDEETLKEIYPAYVNPRRGSPTSGEFIKYQVSQLKSEGWTL